MIRGPLEYVPPVEVEVVTKRKAIPLDENEGIYVRDIKTGKVREGCGRGRVDQRRGVEEGGWIRGGGWKGEGGSEEGGGRGWGEQRRGVEGGGWIGGGG